MARRKFLYHNRPGAVEPPGPERWGAIRTADLGERSPDAAPGEKTVPVDQGDGTVIWEPLPGGGGDGTPEPPDVGGPWVGEARNYSGIDVPPGWVRAAGGELPKDTFPALWAKYADGTRHGPPSSPAVFRMPDYGPLEALVPNTEYWVWPGRPGPGVRITFDSTLHTWDGTTDTWDGD